jgi:hypothetical protein
MYEKRLREISKKIEPLDKDLEKYFVLTNKKKNREIYFKDNKEAVNFIEIKFNLPSKKKLYSFKKKATYLLLKTNLLKPFLKNIKLSKKIGDVIFVGGKIKSFHLKESEVMAFPKNKKDENDFVSSQKFKKRVSKKGFAPEVYEINEEVPYEREELLEYSGKIDYPLLFEKINKFYQAEGIEKIDIKKYTKNLINKLEKKGIKNKFLYKTLKNFSKEKLKLLISTIHGDFAPEQALIKGKDIVFVDWEPKKDLITCDLLNCFNRKTKDIQSEGYFKKIMGYYPKEVRKDIKTYLVLSEISLLIKKTKNIEKQIENKKERIRNHLSH